MNLIKKNFLKTLAIDFILSFLMIISVVPGFKLIGNLAEQIAVTFLLSGIFIVIADRLRIDIIYIAQSVSIMSLFWVFYALISQIKFHIDTNDFSMKWQVQFFYDKIGLIFVPYIFLIGYMILKLFYNSGSKQFLISYKKFCKFILISFTVYYLLVLFYAFFICRTSGQTANWSLVPFRALKSIFIDKVVYYDTLTYYVGNLVLFMPLGVITLIFTKGKKIWLVFFIPIVFSFCIEELQFIFKTGEPDVEDIILNSLGAWVAAGFKLLLDKIIKKKSKGKIPSVFMI